MFAVPAGACRRCLHDAGRARPCADSTRIRTGASRSPNSACPLGISPGHLQRLFRRVLGVSPARYSAAARARAVQATRPQERQRDGRHLRCGLWSKQPGLRNRRVLARNDAGHLPEGGSGMRIHYAVRPCPLGYVLVGATGRGICAVRLGDEPEELASGLRYEFPKAQIFEMTAPCSRDRRCTGRSCRRRTLPRSSAGRSSYGFSGQGVAGASPDSAWWDEVIQRNRGRARPTFGGAGGGARPRNNPAALVIPCHRVVHAGGDPTGYRWGERRNDFRSSKPGLSPSRIQSRRWKMGKAPVEYGGHLRCHSPPNRSATAGVLADLKVRPDLLRK